MADFVDTGSDKLPSPNFRAELIQRLTNDQGERGYDLVAADQIQFLSTFDSPDHPVLSLYLDISPVQRPGRKYQLALKELIRNRAEALDRAQHDAFMEEAARVEDFVLYRYAERGVGLAIFSCAEHGLWHVYRLPERVYDLLVFDQRPYLRPLLTMIDNQERYGVILVDRQQARLFQVFLGEIEEYTDLVSDVPRYHKQGGWSAARYQRHSDNEALHHLKRVADLAPKFFEQQEVNHILLGGTDENVAWFRQYLPEALQVRISGTFPIRIDAPDQAILDKVMEIQHHVERQVETDLVQTLITTASKGGPAVVGLDETLMALAQQRVMTLVVADNFHASGTRCTYCGDLTADPSASERPCRLCGQKQIERVDHLVNLMMHKVMEQEGRVEVVEGGRAPAERIGAMLRY